MKKRYNQFNPKRKIKQLDQNSFERCREIAEKIKYGGNPEHKKDPGDFGLTPPVGARPGKSLCDAVRIFKKREALELIRSGFRKGLVSDLFHEEWPQNIWAVTEDGYPVEAQLENQSTGTYHGYPMPSSDPLASEIVRRWKIADEKKRIQN